MTGHELLDELSRLLDADPAWLDGPVKIITPDHRYYDVTEVDAEAHPPDIDPSGSGVGEVTIWLRTEVEPRMPTGPPPPPPGPEDPF